MSAQSGNQGIGMTSARTRDRLVRRLKEHGIRSEAVLNQIRNVPRHLFVDEALASRAYEDTALPIGHGQTISQPYIVARMTEALLDGFDGDKVLEIGTGCGYQTAILSPLVKKIYSVERIPELLRKTRQRLRDLGIYNVQFKPGGRLIIPVGPPRAQDLVQVTRRDDHYEQVSLGPVSFVPLVKDS